LVLQRGRADSALQFLRNEKSKSHFPSGFFVKLVAYVDESGTDGNSAVLIVGGLVALREEWTRFCKSWQKVLNDYSAKYFHFREWADASAVIRKKRTPSSEFEKNPYKSWDQNTLDRFLFELAEVAVADGRLVVGGYVPQIQLRAEQASGETTTTASPEELCAGHFFDAVVSTISKERCVLKRQGISFFFDHSTNKQWKNVVNNAFDISCQKHRQCKTITFVSKGLRERVENGAVEFLPLQAADMVAYRMRQKMEKLANLDFTGPEWDKLDNILFKSINEANAAWSATERDAVLRKVFRVPESATYEDAMDSIVAKSKFKK
jgi:hypothetical protein